MHTNNVSNSQVVFDMQCYVMKWVRPVLGIIKLGSAAQFGCLCIGSTVCLLLGARPVFGVPSRWPGALRCAY